MFLRGAMKTVVCHNTGLLYSIIADEIIELKKGGLEVVEVRLPNINRSNESYSRVENSRRNVVKDFVQIWRISSLSSRLNHSPLLHDLILYTNPERSRRVVSGVLSARPNGVQPGRQSKYDFQIIRRHWPFSLSQKLFFSVISLRATSSQYHSAKQYSPLQVVPHRGWYGSAFSTFRWLI